MRMINKLFFLTVPALIFCGAASAQDADPAQEAAEAGASQVTNQRNPDSTTPPQPAQQPRPWNKKKAYDPNKDKIKRAPVSRGVPLVGSGSAGDQAKDQGDRKPDPQAGGASGKTEIGNIEVSAKSDCLKNRSKGPFKLDFQKADIIDIVKFISELTCTNFIIPDGLRQGKISIMSPQPVTVDEAYQAFLSSLEVNKLTIVPSGRYLKLMGQKDSISSTIPTVWGNQDYPMDDRMITKIIRLNYVDSSVLAPTLKQLASKDGDVYTYQPTNTLIISDTGSNLYKLEQIIKQLDTQGPEEEIQLIQVNYATATQLAEKLTAIYDIKQGQKTAVSSAPKVAGRKGAAQPPPQAPAGKSQDQMEVRISKILADDRTNKLIIIGSPNSIREVVDVIKKLDVPVAGEGQVHVYYLENADAEKLASTLSSLSQSKSATPRPTPQAGAKGGAAQQAELFSGDVKITADKATNSLVIIANSHDYKNVVNVIRTLDIARKQVFVEAVIMEVTLGNQFDLGVAVSGGTAMTSNGTKFPVFGGTSLGGLNSIAMDAASLASMGGLIGGAIGPSVDGVSLGSAKISLPSFGVVLRALQQNNDVNVLSTPHLMTMDNEEAEILVGQNVPYQSGFTSNVGGTSVNSFNPIVSIQRMDVALKMKIKPQISNSEFVKLNIEEEVSEIIAQDQLLGPTTSKRQAKTVVVAKDQQTVAIGGLIKDNQTTSVYKVPFFGDIPIIGWLFRNKSSQTTKTNLMMFLTPYIIRDKEDFRRIFERKMKERQEFIQMFYGAIDDYKVYIDYGKKRGPFAEMNMSIDGEMKRFENEGPGVEGETAITPDGVMEPGRPSSDVQSVAPAAPAESITREVPPATVVEPAGEAQPAAPASPIAPVAPPPRQPAPEERMEVQ